MTAPLPETMRFIDVAAPGGPEVMTPVKPAIAASVSGVSAETEKAPGKPHGASGIV